MDEEIFNRLIIIMKSMQLPIVSMLSLIGWQVFKQTGIRAFKFIFIAWSINAIYILFKLLERIGHDHEPMWVMTWISWLSYVLNFSNGNQEIKVNFFKCIDIFLDLIPTYLILYASKGVTFKGKSYLEQKSIYYILFFAFLYPALFVIYLSEGDFALNLILTILNMAALGLLAVYMRNVEDIVIHKTFFIGIGLYLIIQPFSLVDSPEVIFTGYSLGIVSKCLMLYGLTKIFIHKTRESYENKVVVDKLNRFLGRTFHEIMPPVIEIKNIASALNRNEAARDIEIVMNKKSQREVERMTNAVNRLVTIISASHKIYIQDIDFLKLESQLYDLEIPIGEGEQINNVNVLIEIAIMSLKSKLDVDQSVSGRVYFKTEYGANCNVFCNSVEMVQIFYNLFKNSLEAVGDSSCEIFIKTKNLIKEDGKEKEIIIEIEDDGPGISHSIQNRIFDDGFTTKRDPGKGRGFGLEIVKSYTIKNGGVVNLLSPIPEPYLPNSKDRGAKFSFRFPKAKIHL